MAFLIDGYNLLHVTGLVGRAGTGLQGSREALLRFLAASLDAKERRETTIVFDAAEAPPGLPRSTAYDGMTVRYSSDYADADELIEELIADHNAPRSLTVVSSDHRIQRAARRRRAPFVDSDVWFAEILRRRKSGVAKAAESRAASLSADEIAYWLDEFSGAPQEPDETCPFPPGHGEDLLES